MPEFFAFGFEVAFEGGFGGDGGADAFDYSNASGFQGGDFFGVVGDQADGGDVELLEDLGGEIEVAIVVAEAEFEVGFDGVAALVLELIGAELGHEADTAALLVLVEQDAGALFGDGAEGEVELVVAVAAERVEDVSGEALGVDADDGRSGLKVAHGEGDGRLDGLTVGVAGLGEALEAENAELSPAGGEGGIGDLANGYEGHGSIIDSAERQGIQAGARKVKACMRTIPS
jgi:hypothetical protein